MKHLVIGNLAHVDAGKTTLSEAILYRSGKIKQLGRVDHQDAYLDYDGQERNRGITIFSKQAVFSWKESSITLLDTPGHIDFSTEMERTLQVLDVAILVISGTDGVQTHTKTIWQLLERYQVPTLIFVNKMDMPDADFNRCFNQIEKELSSNIVDFTLDNALRDENISLTNDKLLEKYLHDGKISLEEISNLIMQRRIFPCFSGSALKIEGVDLLLDTIVTYIDPIYNDDSFTAQVFKITRDSQGQRLAHLKITGGLLKVKDVIGDNEKVDQIRLYSGIKYEALQEASAGMICAVKGLNHVYAGDFIGKKKPKLQPILASCMDYRVILPDHYDTHQALPLLMQLSEEDPSLHVSYDAKVDEIRIRLMGDIQIEVLKQQILQRFNIAVDFDHGKILYKETIKAPVLGVGHYEPLRHYAEVHLLLEPGKPGSGVQYGSRLKEDILAKHWQNLILTHLKEKEHLGVLTGSPITDIKITLVNGKFHLKHTEGGDFREATYRAVRQGLKMAESILLEPYFSYKAQIPSETLSRFIYHIDEMHGSYSIDQTVDTMTYLHGEAPVSKMQNYYQDMLVYTKGKGKIQYTISGYKPCENQEKIIETIGYDSEGDLENPTGSVFCSHGAGYNVPYNEVYDKMHLETEWQKKETIKDRPVRTFSKEVSDDDLTAIFERTYGPIHRKTIDQFNSQKKEVDLNQSFAQKGECLLVDGYNVIFSWPELKELANDNLDVARARLIDILSNFQGYKQCLLILVFDAYKVKDNPGTIEKYHNIYIVYTKEAQTADMFIERTTHQMAKNFHIAVVTSDALEQLIVTGQGARRISSREFLKEVSHFTSEKLKTFLEKQKKDHYFPLGAVEDYQKSKE